MIARHIHHALAQVQELRQKVLEKQRFKGYSGRARAISGTVALAATLVMASPLFPTSFTAHLLGWGVVFLIAASVNHGALIYWFLFDPGVKRDWRRLKPVFDVVPPFFVGAVLTLALVLRGHHDLLFGVWMTLFGLANIATRHVLPRAITLVGLAYIFAGTTCLLTLGLSFTNPWPMGVVFFLGEWAAGIVIHYDGLPPFLNQPTEPP